MSGDPDTLSWRESLKRLGDNGDSDPVTHLVRAVIDGTVSYYPRKAISLEAAYRKGLFDSNTGAWRMHQRDDNPVFVGVVRSDFDRVFGIITVNRWISGEGPKQQSNRAGVASSTDNPKSSNVLERGGRPPTFDWDEFFCEIVRRANTPDGLPERAELTEAMKEWCRQTWHNEPTDSVLREKIAKVYNALDRAP
jgi:hypothetical protein